jgi:hypothetical protein
MSSFLTALFPTWSRYARLPDKSSGTSSTMAAPKHINRRVPDFDTFYPLNEPQIGSAYSSVSMRLFSLMGGLVLRLPDLGALSTE